MEHPPSLPFRYPGTKPFTTDQAGIFFGRQGDVDKLYAQLKDKQLVTLYSESGMGKSSLINAGLIPEFNKRSTADHSFSVMKIRFGRDQRSAGEREDSHPDQKSLLDKLVYELRSGLKADARPLPLTGEAPGSVVWHLIKRYEWNGQRLLIIFDQSEELFDYPEKEITEFRDQLAEITGTDIPEVYDQVVSDRVITHGDAGEGNGNAAGLEQQVRFIYQRIEAKLLFVVRSDKLGAFKAFENRFPNILRDTFQLLPLSERGAREAIEKPAALKTGFATPAFSYAPAALKKLLGKLEEPGGFDPFSIQLNCQYIERKIVSKDNRVIDEEEVPDNRVVVDNYLERVWSALPVIPGQTLNQFRKALAKKLVNAENQKRNSALDGAWLDREAKEVLLGHGLTKEDSWGGNTYIELSHDRLVLPLLEGYQRIKAEEAEQKIRSEEARKRLVKEGFFRRIIWRVVIGAFVIGGAIAIIIARYAMDQRNQAVEAQKWAERQRLLAVRAGDSLSKSKRQVDSLYGLLQVRNKQLLDTNMSVSQQNRLLSALNDTLSRQLNDLNRTKEVLALLQFRYIEQELRRLELEKQNNEPQKKVPGNRQDVDSLNEVIAGLNRNISAVNQKISAPKVYSSWFKEGYYLNFGSIKITLREISSDGRTIRVDICETASRGVCGTVLSTGHMLQLKESYSFTRPGYQYTLRLDRIGREGFNFLKPAADVTFTITPSGGGFNH